MSNTKASRRQPTQSAWGTDINGDRVQVWLPAWNRAHSFWGVWEACHHLSATAEAAASENAPEPVSERQLAGARAGSSIEARAILETQMRLGAESIVTLAGSQLIFCDPAEAAQWPPFASRQEATAWAAFETLGIQQPLFLDLTSSGHGKTIAMDMGPGQRSWQMSAALVARTQQMLAITVFAAPSDPDSQIDEPPSVPQGRVLFSAGQTYMPKNGELLVDVISGQTYAREVHDPQSDVLARITACFHLSLAALTCLRHVTSDDVELVPALRDPKRRRLAKQRGEKLGLLPRPRPV